LFMVHIRHGDPFVGSPRSFEPAAGYLAVALLMLLTGPGCLSLDALIFRPMFGKRVEKTNP
jgi:putative oxidoreductase